LKTEINSSKKILKELGIKFGVRSEKKLSLAKAIIAKILYIDERSKKLPPGDICYVPQLF
jgi:hypothetical protein